MIRTLKQFFLLAAIISLPVFAANGQQETKKEKPKKEKKSKNSKKKKSRTRTYKPPKEDK
jgi:hypothetical protein